MTLSLLFSREAMASHYRYGTVNWVVPDPQAAPNTVKFTVTYGIVFGSPVNLRTITLDFGDGMNFGAVAGPIVGTGIDAGGFQYEVREFTATHTYAAAGNYTAFFQDCCRLNTLINGSGLDYRVEAKVVLQPGNTSGPVSASPPLIQLQIGGTRTYSWPAFDPDPDPVTCRFATEAEVGFPNPTPVVPNPPGPGNGGQAPTLMNVANGCQLSWDLIDAQAGQRYVVHVILESTHGGQLSSTALDLMVEMITPPPPTCAGTNVFITDVGQMLSTMVTGSNDVASNLTVSTINAPPGSTLLPGDAGPSPFSNTFTWTPLAVDRGTTRIALLNYTNTLNHTGTCFLTVQVPQCADFGDPCSTGVGECLNDGTNVCAGPDITVCNAVAGSPIAESCDNKDNDCDGAVDDGFDVGVACTSGQGLCQGMGVNVCDGAGGAKCNAVSGSPTAELCGDNLDQDCDGVMDNGCLDSDGDGLTEAEEDLTGTDPNDADSDNDGVSDGDEPSFDEDSDGDGAINALDSDSDDDGLFDGTEMGFGCDDDATDKTRISCIADGDMGVTKTDPLNADTDGGGVKDGAEDKNHDGVVDDGETDPTIGHGDDDEGCQDDAMCGDGTSGMVCNLDTGACEGGCHSTGNGCTEGKVCTSDDATIGDCVTPGTGGGGGSSPDGNADFYDCAYSGHSGGQGESPFVMVGAALSLMVLLRRRRGERRSL